MVNLKRLQFALSARLPLILQTEATECGLACLAMISGYYRSYLDLITLRNRFPVSLKGVTLAGLIHISARLGLNTRPVKLELEHLCMLKLPCIIHWNFNHFVVLKSVDRKKVTIHDPAQGERHLSWRETSESFTGVALEVWPSTDFAPQEKRAPLRLRDLMGTVTGVTKSCTQVLLLALAIEIFFLVSPFYIQWVIDNVLVSADRDLLSTLAIGFLLLAFMQQVTSFIRSWVLLHLGAILNIQWRANVFSHLVNLPTQYFEKRQLGDVISRFGSIGLIQRTLTSSFLEAILDGLMTIVTLAIMFLYSPILAGVAVGSIVLYTIFRCLWYRPLRASTEEQIVNSARQEGHFLETVRGIKAIKLFQRQEVRIASWQTLLIDQVNAEIRTQKMQAIYKILNGLFFGIENILIIWLGARLVLNGNFSVGVLVAFNSYRTQFDSRVSALVDKFFEVKMLQLQGERLADIILAQPEQLSSKNFSSETNELAPSITVRGLRYRYSEQDPFVLDGIDFEISAGQSVAIVGPSGCGKSTLMNILVGLLPTSEGEILIGDKSIKRLGIEEVRSIIGVVSQDDVLFAGSISDNITFFDPHPDRKWMEECAIRAAIAVDINSMPMGYNTLVGDMGTVLSGGQKQRILLARALYKRPRVLVLDEATSHLDVGKEHEVNMAVKALEMTRIIVAHRPETIASADRVIVLMAGKVVQDVLAPPEHRRARDAA